MQKNKLLNRIKELSSPISPKKTGHDTDLKTLTGIKCIAFDFYGTMFISAAGDIGIDENRDESNMRFFEEALKSCDLNILDDSADKIGIKEFNKVLERHGDKMKKNKVYFPEPDVRDIFYSVLTNLQEKKVIEGNITKDTATLCVVEFEFRSNAIWPMPDLLTHLERLNKNGFTLGIISNSQFYTPLSFEAITGSPVNDFGFVEELQKWSYRHGIKKPSMSFYRLFIEELPKFKLKPDEVLYVGNDLFKDVLPAKKLGMKTALFTGDKRSIRHKSEDLIEKQLPDIIIDDLAQIEECI